MAVFQNGEVTNLLFFFGEEKLDMGKLAVWPVALSSGLDCWFSAV